MILSFHPIFEGDKNILCAGREPGADDLAAVRAADAVILPQGCKASLYTMARENCANVFPNYDARFEYPGKIGQTRLFRKLNAPHPKTEIYTSHSSFLTSHSSFLTSHSSLLTSHFSLLTSHFLLSSNSTGAEKETMCF